jgi:hypothetical protein
MAHVASVCVSSGGSGLWGVAREALVGPLVARITRIRGRQAEITLNVLAKQLPKTTDQWFSKIPVNITSGYSAQSEWNDMPGRNTTN